MTEDEKRTRLIGLIARFAVDHNLVLPCASIADYLLTNGVTIQQWIPVTEQKAPEGVLALCIGARGGMFIGEMASWRKAIDGSVYCSVPNARGGRSATHWMPLPKPPKEE